MVLAVSRYCRWAPLNFFWLLQGLLLEAYDELGNRYEIPPFCLADPTNVLQDGDAARSSADVSVADASPSSAVMPFLASSGGYFIDASQGADHVESQDSALDAQGPQACIPLHRHCPKVPFFDLVLLCEFLRYFNVDFPSVALAHLLARSLASLKKKVEELENIPVARQSALVTGRLLENGVRQWRSFFSFQIS